MFLLWILVWILWPVPYQPLFVIAQSPPTDNPTYTHPITNRAGVPLPACAHDHVPTAYATLDDWPRTLLDTRYHLPDDYAPDDLVSVAEAGFEQTEKYVRSVMLADLKALQKAASNAGVPLAIQSAYRSYDYQARTFDYWVNVSGEAAALVSSARAGHSEHQLGTAVDFRSATGPAAWDLADWADTPAGAWTVANAWRYGFVLSYPKHQQERTCYIYEPWHYRYVGKELARAIHESNLTLREWLWQQQP